VIPNGVDTRLFRPGERGPARRRLGLAGDARLVLAVGRLDPIKGLDLLVAAVATLHQRGRRGVQCRIVGEGPARAGLGRAIAAAGWSARRAAGSDRPEAIGDWYAAADCVCLLSHTEGCPNVVLEALACGRPSWPPRSAASPTWCVRRRRACSCDGATRPTRRTSWPRYSTAPGHPKRSPLDGGRDWDAVARAQIAVYREVIG